MRLSSQKVLGLLKRSLMPNRPFHVQWMITRRCNYRCKSCSVWRVQDKKKELTTDEVKKGLDILKKLGVLEIVFSGGNPLLREDIGEILNYASRFFITTVYDNGSMAVKKIDALRNTDFVAISLDTLDEKKHDFMRGVQGAWKDAMNAIETLHKEGISVGVGVTISQLNLHEIARLTKHFTSLGIPVWFSLYSHDYLATDNKLFSIGEKSDEFEIIDKKGMIKLCGWLLKIKREQKGIFITDKTLKALKQLFQNGRRVWKCQALQSFFVIDQSGRVAGCHLHEPVANVFELLDVWDSEKFENLRRNYMKCTRCTYLCYIFYSLHANVAGNIEIAQDQWKNAKLLLLKG